MKVNEQRIRIKAIYKSMNDPNRSIGMNSVTSSRLGTRAYDDPSGRVNTTQEQSTATNLTQSKNRDNVSTRGGMSFGGRSEFEHLEPPFLILQDQESLNHFMSKQRKMVSSVSSKYLNYNPLGKNTQNIGDGVSTIRGENDSPNKIGNYNEYQHIYNDHQCNEANVAWITQLREKENKTQLGQSKILIDNDKQSTIHESSPPSVYYKSNGENCVKRVTDFEYKGNHLDVTHLTTKRIGPTPNIGQVNFETSLRKYLSQKDLKSSIIEESKRDPRERTSQDQIKNEKAYYTNNKNSNSSSLERAESSKDFVTIFPKQKSILSQYAPTFLPPIGPAAKRQYDKLDVILEKTKTLVKGLHKKPEALQLVSSFEGFHKSMPKFTDKIETAHDYNQIRHLMKANKKMSQVLWELSLRPDAHKKDEIEENRRKEQALLHRKNIQYFSEPKRRSKPQNNLQSQHLACKQLPLRFINFNNLPAVQRMQSFYQAPQRSFVKSMEDRKEEQEIKAFQDDITYFLSKESFSLHDFHERVLHGLKQKSTFKVMIWGDDAEMKILENQNKICSAMHDEEKNNSKSISMDQKREIAETCQLQLSDVQDVLHKYMQMQQFHLWLKGKQQRKEPMPETRDDLMAMYKIERPSFLMPKKHQGGSQKRQMKYYLRRHRT
ncbi:UNKNOWN [Stylonychia lemnae]|uniref:Uncharacterized protein n=1 Tax=Stylonychia lemnae TaxID=5949 RepID=A0A078AX50_STYLE|nr:UNKNOWN [Stylonychia lemnae]|eukprot:CDW85368.1 UNKNOWN [Stylonychia lemnae]